MASVLLPITSNPEDSSTLQDVPLPLPLYSYTPLTRQIRENYWVEVEDYMQRNTDIQEYEVLTSNYEWGWVYTVKRTENGDLIRLSEYQTKRDFRHSDFEETRSECDPMRAVAAAAAAAAESILDFDFDIKPDYIATQLLARLREPFST